MIITRVRYKYTIVRVDVEKLERFKPIEIRLPANVKRVIGVLVTATRK
jgi:hypothetical protein